MITIMEALIAAALGLAALALGLGAVVNGLVVRELLRGERRRGAEAVPPAPGASEDEAASSEREQRKSVQWQEGIASILDYDMNKAVRAARGERDGETE